MFASTDGDLAISDYMSETLARTPTLISPIRFHNSVHNAAAGYWTIGTGCMQPYTALTAHEDTFGEGLLEALTQAECERASRPAGRLRHRGARPARHDGHEPRHRRCRCGRLAAGTGADSLARVRWRTVRGTERTAPLARNAELVAGNAMAACLPFFEAVALAEARTVWSD